MPAIAVGTALAALNMIWGFYLSEVRSAWWLLGSATDFAIGSYVCLILLLFQRRIGLGVLLVAAVLITAQLAAIAKTFILQSSIQMSDLMLVDDLVIHYLSEGALAVAVLIVAVGLPVGLFLCNLRRPQVAELILLVPLAGYLSVIFLRVFAGSAAAAILPPANNGYYWFPPAMVYGQTGTFLQSGMTLAERGEHYRQLAATEQPDFGFVAGTMHSSASRNVHIIILESLIDPATIGGLTMQSDPFAPMFADWRRADGMRAMQPVLGGRSPDGVFEILCGIPVTLDGGQVLFSLLADEDISCLPNKLRSLGYRTETWMAVSPGEFNYDAAYRKLGFATRLFRDDMDMSDRDGETLSAESSLRQNLARVTELLKEEAPLLNFVFVTAGHFPYFLDREKRPHHIAVAPQDEIATAYVNSAYYTTHAVQAYIERLQHLDPESVILAVGDHPPALPVMQPGLTYPRPIDVRYDVPLLLFDGAREYVPLSGQIPGYEVPELVADILTDGRFCRENRCHRESEVAVRPLPDGLLAYDRETGAHTNCAMRPESGPCIAAHNFANRSKLAIFGLIGFD